MKHTQLLILTLAAITMACNEKSFQYNDDTAATLESDLSEKVSRPHETGEGVPGYIFCKEQGEASTSDYKINCRLEANNTKLDTSSSSSDWNLLTAIEIDFTKKLLPDDSPWHVAFTLGGSATKRRDVVQNSVIELVLDKMKYSVPTEAAIEKASFSSQQIARFLFGPQSSGRASDWLGLNLDAPTSDPLQATMATPLGIVKLTLSSPTGSLEPLGPINLNGESPWREMCASAISGQGTIDVSVSDLTPGQYAVTVFIGNCFINEDQEFFLENVKKTEPTQVFSQLTTRSADSFSNETDIVKFRFMSRDMINFRISSTDGKSVYINSILIGKLP